MYYQFKKEDAESFQRSTGIFAKERGNELQFQYCPYCHGGKHKDKGSFSINLTSGQFECKRSSCGVHGNMITLAKDFDFSLGAEYDRYYKRDYSRYIKPRKKEIETREPAVNYMLSRGISEAVSRKYKLTTVPDKDNILVFPFFDDKGMLVSSKYRKTDFDKAKDKNKEWFESNCMPILFGMEQCNKENKTLVITEGQIDSLSVAEAGIENSVSVPNGARGFTWIPYCWDWFSKFEKLIVFGDFENGKMTLLDELKTRFPGRVCAVREEDYKGCKDANEILKKFGKEAVRNAVENAKELPVRNVKELADVESVDIYSMDKISTGIKSVDDILGGFYAGQVILLTGKRGKGKSTLASQFCSSVLKQDKKIFAYSGELQDYFFKRWIDFQIAGPDRIVETTNQYGEPKKFITNSNIDKINNWYRGKAYIYDNNIIEDEEPTDLLKTIEESVMQYGIDVVLIDNLMTAIEIDVNSDLYRAQSMFVNKLCKLAKRHNVVIILIVHPRKNKFTTDENDEVSGSADITNRVDVVMTYKSDDDLSDDMRYLSISKNRLTGKLTADKGIELYYDDKSKRINDTGNFAEDYGWDKEFDGFIDIPDDDSMPFSF
ncbi:MAG: AAA family ATPase [Eubacterium sp.]|nr:AAA family ATPase [Eubacterium sp.]